MHLVPRNLGTYCFLYTHCCKYSYSRTANFRHDYCCCWNFNVAEDCFGSSTNLHSLSLSIGSLSIQLKHIYVSGSNLPLYYTVTTSYVDIFLPRQDNLMVSDSYICHEADCFGNRRVLHSVLLLSVATKPTVQCVLGETRHHLLHLKIRVYARNHRHKGLGLVG